MSENILFIRKAELIIGPKVSGTNAAIEPVDARSFNTRLNFEIIKDESGNANKSKISIYNISEESKTFLEQDNLVIFLNAGFGVGISNIFFGDLQRFTEKRNGPDIITTIECGESENILRDAHIQIGLGPGATNRQIIDMAIDKLSLSKGFQVEIPLIKYQNGFSFSGTVKKLMNEQMKLVNLNWSIQAGEMQILGENETDEQVAIELSASSGLIGMPTKT